MKQTDLRISFWILITFMVLGVISFAQKAEWPTRQHQIEAKLDMLGEFVSMYGDSVVTHQTNPATHKHSVVDGSGNSVTFSAKLTMGQLKSSDTAKNGDISGVAFELKNLSNSTSGYDFKVDQVRLIHSDSSNTKSWNFTPPVAVNKGNTGNWSNPGRIPGYKWNKSIMEIRILFGTRTWLLKWDPTVSGAGSTSVAES